MTQEIQPYELTPVDRVLHCARCWGVIPIPDGATRSHIGSIARSHICWSDGTRFRRIVLEVRAMWRSARGFSFMVEACGHSSLKQR